MESHTSETTKKNYDNNNSICNSFTYGMRRMRMIPSVIKNYEVITQYLRSDIN